MTALMLSTRAELLRLRKWSATWVVLGAWVSLALLFGYVFDYVAYKTGNSMGDATVTKAELLHDLMPVSMPDVLVRGMPMFGGALIMVLGALVAGGGYGWGTWKTVFTQGPSRGTVIGGSLAALTTLVVGVLAVTLVLDTGASLLVAATEGQTVVWPAATVLLKSVGTGFLVLEMWALFGFALGTLARGPGLSIGLGLVWVLVVENLLRGVGSLLTVIADITHVLPGTAAGSLVGSLTGTSGVAAAPGVLNDVGGAQALLTVAVYAVLLPVFAIVLVRRRDVA
jgi:ABC-2 type transport system permease protein